MTTTTTPIKPMRPLSGRIKDLKEGKAYIVQPKLRGIRATWDPVRQALMTRNGNALTAVDQIVGAIKASPMSHIPLDGEIYVHGMPFKKISGLARRKKSSDETAVLEFHVFDIAAPDGGDAEYRIMVDLAITTTFRPNPHYSCLKRVFSRIENSRADIRDAYHDFLEDAYEGIIIRDPEAPYTPGPSQSLIKIKSLNDMEAKLVGFLPAGPESRNADTFGSLLLMLNNGALLRCSGIGDDERAQLWRKKPIGQPVTFMYDFIDPDSGIPQGARYVEIRWDK